MSDAAAVPPRAAAGWLYWAIAVLSLPWNAFGAYDYTMTNMRDAEYLKAFPPEMMPIIDAFPYWAIAAWACGVWGALAGSLLLLLRSRFAFHAFAISLAGLALSTGYQASLDMPETLKTAGMTVMNLVIWLAAIFFLWWAWRSRKAGLLR